MANQTYINARCKALENKLIPTKKLYQIIDSQDIQEALKLLNETKFFETKVEDAFDIEKFIQEKKQEFFNMLNVFSLDQDIKEFFMLPTDFYNGEVLLTSKLQNDLSLEDLLVCNGLSKIEDIKEAINNQKYQNISPKLASVLEKIQNEDIDTNNISNIFKTKLYESLKVKNKLLQKIIDTKIDLINIDTLFRAKSFYDFENQKINAGSLEDKFFKDLFTFDKKLLLRYKNHYLYKDIEYILDNFENKDKLFDLENKISSIGLIILEPYKYDSSGLLPFLLYAFRLNLNLENLRIIFVSLANKLDKQEIKRRLRWNYER